VKRLQAAGLYFLLVFGAGFMLGTVRVLFIVPAIGERAAELLEMPLMILVVAMAARFIVKRFANSIHGTRQWLHVGALALACMLTADLGVGVALRGMTIWQALFARDPVSGTAYYLALGFLALAPWLFARGVRCPGAVGPSD
jgi:hypothetical protein